MGRIRTYLEQILKFGFVGALGTLTNSLVFFLLVDCAGLWANLGAVCAFCVAVTQNFFLNRYWTFSNAGGLFKFQRVMPASRKGSLFTEYGKFVAVSLGGLAVNLAVLNIVLLTIRLPAKTLANLLGVGAGMVVNFLGYRLWVFRARRKPSIPSEE